MVRVLIDTNVIIDALAAREPFCVDAEELLTLAAEEKIVGCITGSSVTDIYYLIRRVLSHSEALDAIKMLLQTLYVVPVGEDECLEALESGMPDFEAAVAAVCAVFVEADCIVTRDEDFVKTDCPMPVLPPAVFLTRLRQGK